MMQAKKIVELYQKGCIEIGTEYRIDDALDIVRLFNALYDTDFKILIDFIVEGDIPIAKIEKTLVLVDIT